MKSRILSIQDSGPLQASLAMQPDFKLLENGEVPALRFYEWSQPSLSFGILNREGGLKEVDLIKNGIPWVYRPTGGSVLLHGHDLSFSLFIPDPHFLGTAGSSYLLINNMVLEALATAFDIDRERLECFQSGVRSSRGVSAYCMAESSLYDPLLDGKKVGGSAQRRTKKAFLHQGSLFIREPAWESFAPVLPDDILLKMQNTTTSFNDILELDKKLLKFKKLLANSFQKCLFDPNTISIKLCNN